MQRQKLYKIIKLDLFTTSLPSDIFPSLFEEYLGLEI